MLVHPFYFIGLRLITEPTLSELYEAKNTLCMLVVTETFERYVITLYMQARGGGECCVF